MQDLITSLQLIQGKLVRKKSQKGSIAEIDIACKTGEHSWFFNHITGKTKCIYCGELKNNYILGL